VTIQRLLVGAVMNPSLVRRLMMMKRRTMRKRQKTRMTSLR
jgi:hypothetical protein